MLAVWTMGATTVNSSTEAMDGWTITQTTKVEGTKIWIKGITGQNIETGEPIESEGYYSKERDTYWLYGKDDEVLTKSKMDKMYVEEANMQLQTYNILKECKFADFGVVDSSYVLKVNKLAEYATTQNLDGLSKLTISSCADKKIKEVFSEMAEKKTIYKITLSDYNKTTVTLPTVA